MAFEGNIFRPPVEHDSLLLQVTVGCSHNTCLFCGMYKDKTYRVKDEIEIFEDIRMAASRKRRSARIFLCDGDALSMPTDRLIRILEEIKRKMPWVARVGSYANAISLAEKSPEELQALRRLNLSMIDMGVESGDDETLKRMNKGIDIAGQIEQGRKVGAAGMRLSVTVLLGLAGLERSQEHARLTGKALTAINPNHVGALSLMIVPEVPLSRMVSRGEFEPIDPVNTLKELRTMVEHTNLTKGIFSANHASNYLPLQARFPDEKQQMLDILDEAIRGRLPLTPEFNRGL